MAAKRKPNEIFLERLFDASLAQVWDAWTDVSQVDQWWGPRGFTTTTHGKDLRPGGVWHYTMVGPDGTTWENKTLYLEVEPRARLVYDHGGSDERKPLFRVTVLFSEQAGKTKMQTTMALATAEEAEQTRARIRAAGGNSTWDRLAEHLEICLADKDVFVTSRTFDASREVVFKMWTEPTHMAEWTVPAGGTMTALQADIRTGGRLHSCLQGSDGNKMYTLLRYVEVRPSEFLSYLQQFSSESGATTRHPLEPRWPETLLTSVTFVAEDEGLTRLTIRWEISGESTYVEREIFSKAKGGMAMGWTGMLDNLEATLSRRR